MADPTSYIELLEQSQQLEYLINSDCISDEEKEELQVAWNFITSRSESKFDCIIGDSESINLVQFGILVWILISLTRLIENNRTVK